VDEKWVLLKCPCGNFFGSSLGSNTSCTRCSNSKDIVTASSYPSPEKLADAVSRSNMPDEISNEVSKRLSKIETRQNRARERESQGRESVISAMREATGQDGIMSLKSVRESLIDRGLKEVDPWELIEDAEREGILHRAGVEAWRWVQ
tara:strand:+ start:2862 stop:3305 length:444 start_codon:yes stop_codon:yes gene_type:complete